MAKHFSGKAYPVFRQWCSAHNVEMFLR